ncbi:unnamed protein product, partial [Polarella glacialis]
HAVLDLCSAPGSKTCQLLDALMSDRSNESSRCLASDGLLVANDLRAERVERLWSRARWQPCSPLVVTAIDGTVFPTLPGLEAGFDRILVDVPCSSDGTARKELKRLEKWSVASGLSHHSLQLGLLLRGLALLKPGGRLVYSTCSLNPLECEAVVQAALKSNSQSSSSSNAGGDLRPRGLRLLPAEEALPKGCPRGLRGLETWRVPDPDFERTGLTFCSAAEAACHEYPASLFPSAPEEARRLGLQSCARFLPTHGPHFGGFFLAVFELDHECPDKEERPMTGPQQNSALPEIEVEAEGSIEAVARQACTPLFVTLADADRQACELLVDLFGLCVDSIQQLSLFAEDGVVAQVSRRMLRLGNPGPPLLLLHAGLPLLRRVRQGAGKNRELTEPEEPPHTAWQICPEGANCLAEMATRRKLSLAEPLLLRLLRVREATACFRQPDRDSDAIMDECPPPSDELLLGQALQACHCEEDGPILVHVPLRCAAGLSCGGVWLGGGIASGCVSLSAPADVLGRYVAALLQQSQAVAG